MSEQPTDVTPLSVKQIVRSVGWLDAMSGGDVEWSDATWASVEEDGLIYLEGRLPNGDLIDATFKFVEATWQADYDAAIDWNEDDDD